jgi:hypothetical protein
MEDTMSKSKIITTANHIHATRQRITPGSASTAREIEAAMSDPTNPSREAIVSALLRMTEHLLLSPSPVSGELAAELYRATVRAWQAARPRDSTGLPNPEDEREREGAALHELLHDALHGLTVETQQDELDTEEQSDGQGDNEYAPVDLNLWRQVHPRPIKNCVVDVKGGGE